MSEDSPKLTDWEAREAAARDLEHSLLLSAGAGTGKTRSLVDRYVNILASGAADVAHVVAVTFTEKAAKEMKERIRGECRALADQAPDEEQRRAWESHERELENARIGTIHALCARILREHCLAAGLDPHFAVLEEAEAGLLLRQSLRRWILSALQGPDAPLRPLVAAFGLEQACAMLVEILERREDWDGWPLARDADRAALLARWAELDAEALADLVSSHTWQGAVEALRTHEPLDPSDKLAPQREAALQAAGTAADPASPSDQRLSALGQIAELGLRGGSKAKWPSEEALASVKGALKALKEACQDAGLSGAGGSDAALHSSAHLTAALCAVLPEAEKAFSEAKRARSALDFADLQLLARDLLRDDAAVRQRLQAHTRHLLVDEFQDINRLQKEILDYLACLPAGRLDADPQSQRPPAHPGFAVGDAKQSIYRFRGADVSVFTQTRDDFAARQGCRQLPLRTSFRSQPGLVAFSNQVFGHETVMGREQAERDYEARYEDLVPHRCERPEQPDVEIALATQVPTTDEDERETEEREPPTMPLLREVEADWIAERIAEICAPGGLLVFDKGQQNPRPAGFGDVAMLFRSMSDVRLYERALRQRGVPYYVVAGRGLYARQEIRDVLNFLRVLENRHDEVALAGVLRSPFFGVSDKTLYWLTRTNDAQGGSHGEQGRSLRDGLRWAGQADVPREEPTLRHLARDEWPKLQRAWHVIESLRTVRDRLSLAQLIERMVDDTGFRAALLTQFAGEQMAANVRKLIGLARRYEAGGVFGLRSFIGMVEELVAGEEREGEAPIEGEEADVVKLMTIHKAKGLEWPIVIVPDLGRERRGPQERHAIFSPRYGFVLKGEDEKGQRQWPAVGKAAEDEDRAKDLAESRRILYVACTRARDHLILTAAAKPSKQGKLPKDTWIAWLGEALGFDADGAPRELEGVEGQWTGRLVAATTVAPEPERQRRRRSLFERHKAAVSAAQPLPVEGECELSLKLIEPLHPDLPNRRRFTVTELSDYLRCPKGYDLQYLRDLGEHEERSMDDRGAWGSKRKGELAHLALEYLGRERQADPRQVAERALKAFPLGHGRPDEVLANLAELVRRYMDSETFARITRASSLRTEARLLFAVDGALIQGKVDATATDRQGGLHVVDFKTGRGGDDDQHRFQLGLYCAGLGAAEGKLPASATIHYLDQDRAHSLDVPSAADAARSGALEAIAGIRAGHFPPHDHACERCALRWACQPSP